MKTNQGILYSMIFGIVCGLYAGYKTGSVITGFVVYCIATMATSVAVFATDINRKDELPFDDIRKDEPQSDDDLKLYEEI